MGVFDDLSILFNKGVAGAGRVADAASTKMKMGSIDSRRRSACAQLGESLYDLVLATPELQVGREAILAEIAACEQEREALQAELDRIEREAAQARSAAVVYACPVCGAAMSAPSQYCPHCGAAQHAQEQRDYQGQTAAYAAEPSPQEPLYTAAQPEQPAAQPAQPAQSAHQAAYTQVAMPQQPGTAPSAATCETPNEN